VGFRRKGDFQTVLRAAGETETTQENIQNWLQLDEGDPGFQLLTEEEIAAVIFFLCLRATVCFTDPDYRCFVCVFRYINSVDLNERG
jgi:hypothetical protein